MTKIQDRFDWPRLRWARCRILNVKVGSAFCLTDITVVLCLLVLHQLLDSCDSC